MKLKYSSCPLCDVSSLFSTANSIIVNLSMIRTSDQTEATNLYMNKNKNSHHYTHISCSVKGWFAYGQARHTDRQQTELQTLALVNIFQSQDILSKLSVQQFRKLGNMQVNGISYRNTAMTHSYHHKQTFPQIQVCHNNNQKRAVVFL